MTKKWKKNSVDYYSGDGENAANIALPKENFGTTGISLPWSSRALWTEKVERKLAIAIQSEASATCRPTLTSEFKKVSIDS